MSTASPSFFRAGDWAIIPRNMLICRGDLWLGERTDKRQVVRLVEIEWRGQQHLAHWSTVGSPLIQTCDAGRLEVPSDLERLAAVGESQ